ncbi:acyl-CoA dehydrogenase family protein [Nonomuraea sp. 3N208]|uniref:acyl-CoA dehydrogenase family protein n=1 Tax=Nonomuraea sp. 3N208 TaxID=3457421 RepID=UPI003FD0A50B
MSALTEDERDIVALAGEFVDERVRPRVRDYESVDKYPAAFIDEMKKLSFFCLLVPGEHGGVDVSAACFARVTEELARGWMSVFGSLCYMSKTDISVASSPAGRGREAIRWKPMPRPSGEPGGPWLRTALSGPDSAFLEGVRLLGHRPARRCPVGASTNGGRDRAPVRHPAVTEHYRPITFSRNISKNLPKLGYRGVEACELVFDRMRVPASAVLGGEPGQGWAHMVRGLEVGRIQVAARAVGVAQAALDDAIRYAQERESFGKPIWKHQSVGNLLADMATKVRAARLLTEDAARRLDEGARADMEAGMAKLFASEAAMQVALDAMRVHGGYGYSKEFEVERYFRDAPLMILGEGTNEIQRNVIAAQLIARNPIT